MLISLLVIFNVVVDRYQNWQPAQKEPTGKGFAGPSANGKWQQRSALLTHSCPYYSEKWKVFAGIYCASTDSQCSSNHLISRIYILRMVRHGAMIWQKSTVYLLCLKQDVRPFISFFSPNKYQLRKISPRIKINIQKNVCQVQDSNSSLSSLLSLFSLHHSPHLPPDDFSSVLTCVYHWLLVFSIGECWPDKHSATALHPQAHSWLVGCGLIFLPEKAVYLFWLLFLKEAFAFLKHTLHSPHDIGSRWPTVCCETWESNLKKKKFCHGFGMLCFYDENRGCRAGL